jgi:hypothetical protein
VQLYRHKIGAHSSEPKPIKSVTSVWGTVQGLNSGPMLTRQVLYHVDHTPNHFSLVSFPDRVSCICMHLPRGQMPLASEASDNNPLTLPPV